MNDDFTSKIKACFPQYSEIDILELFDASFRIAAHLIVCFAYLTSSPFFVFFIHDTKRWNEIHFCIIIYSLLFSNVIVIRHKFV